MLSFDFTCSIGTPGIDAGQMSLKRNSCSQGQAKRSPSETANSRTITSHRFRVRSIFVVFACSRVRGLLHAAAIRADAALERQEIGQKLQRDQMYEGRKPFGGFGDH